MALLEQLMQRFAEYFPIFLRVSSFLLSLPIFGRGVPSLAKVGLAGLITLLLAPVVPEVSVPQDLAGYAFLVVEEVAVGLAMGLIVTMIFTSVYFAGQLIDVPIGFGMVNVIDPQTGTQVPVMAQFQFVLAILVLFSINGHHALLRALADSFRVLPVGAATVNDTVVRVGIAAFGRMFLIGLRIGLPVMGALFLTDMALGIIARAVPQVNVFFVGFPLKIGLGFAVLILVLPVYVSFVSVVFGEGGDMLRSLREVIHALAGPQ